MYPNPLVSDLIASGIANRIDFLTQHEAELDEGVRDALTRLERELDELAASLKWAADLITGRSFGLFDLRR